MRYLRAPSYTCVSWMSIIRALRVLSSTLPEAHHIAIDRKHTSSLVSTSSTIRLRGGPIEYQSDPTITQHLCQEFTCVLVPADGELPGTLSRTVGQLLTRSFAGACCLACSGSLSCGAIGSCGFATSAAASRPRQYFRWGLH